MLSMRPPAIFEAVGFWDSRPKRDPFPSGYQNDPFHDQELYRAADNRAELRAVTVSLQVRG
jgi:hypothetical protein